MRFLHIDRVVRFEPRVHVESVKGVGVSEEFFRGHFPRRPFVPAALVLESMCQAAGWLVAASHEFHVQPVLALVEDVELPSSLGPGVRLALSADIVSTDERGSVCSARASVDGAQVARVGRAVFGHLAQDLPDAMRALFESPAGSP